MPISSELASGIAARLRKVQAHPVTKRALAIGHWTLLATIVGYLLYRVAMLGPLDIIRAMPLSPWFYVFFALKYLTLPVAETAAYEIVWDRPLAHHFPAFVRKRVYNYAVAGYSGEGFLTLWARRRLGLSDMRALVGVKDNNIISSFAANVATVTLVIGLASAGALGELAALPGGTVLFMTSFLVAASVALIVVLFRKKLIAISADKRRRILAIHLARQVVNITLFAAMYAAALPEAPFGSWLLFVALQLVISRIPFLPNQDLVYLTAALSFASIVGAREEAVAGMLVAEAGLSLIVNFILFFATVYLARRNIEPELSPGA